MKYANAEHTFIEDGTRHIPVAPGNADYDAIIASGAVIEPYTAPATTPSQVKAEARARIVAKYPSWKQLNVIREGGEPLTEMSAYIDAVRAASDVLEASLPVDYSADAHWPE